MKKFFNFMLGTIVTMCLSCTNAEDNLFGEQLITNVPGTEVYVNGTRANQAPNHITRAINTKDSIGYDVPDNGRYLVFYYIRIDGNIPGEEESNLPADEYFPRTAQKKTMVNELNSGYVVADANWNSSNKFEKYVYATDGVAVKNLIINEPTLEDLVNANKYAADDFTGYLAHKDELHCLWYICKKQDAKDHVWHIDGILTSKDRTNVSETIYGDEIINKYPEGEYTDDKGAEPYLPVVEVDIHQQIHKDWNEIKTSVHINNVTDVTIMLPIEETYICESDDFAIRLPRHYEYAAAVSNGNGIIYETVSIDVLHEADGTYLKITGITEELLDAHDGMITVEVHSYFKDLSDDEVWDKMKVSTVEATNLQVKKKGQIHSKDDGKDGKWVEIN